MSAQKKYPVVYPPDLTGVFTRMDFLLFNYYKVPTDHGERYTVAASYSTLVEHRYYGLIRGYARIRVFDDNTSEFHVTHYDAKTLEPKGEMNVVCSIGDAKTGGVVLYNFS